MEVNSEMSYEENRKIEITNRKNKFIKFDNTVKSMKKNDRDNIVVYLVNSFFVLRNLINDDPDSNFDRLYNGAIESTNVKAFDEEQSDLLYLRSHLSQEDFALTPIIDRHYRKNPLVLTSDVIMERLINGEKIEGLIPAKLINGLINNKIDFVNTTPNIRLNDSNFSSTTFENVEKSFREYLQKEITYYEKNKEDILQIDERYFDEMLLFITEQVKSLCFYTLPVLDVNKYLGIMQEILLHRTDNEDYENIVSKREDYERSEMSEQHYSDSL